MFSAWRGQVGGTRLARGASAPGKSAGSTPAGRGSVPGQTHSPRPPPPAAGLGSSRGGGGGGGEIG